MNLKKLAKILEIRESKTKESWCFLRFIKTQALYRKVVLGMTPQHQLCLQPEWESYSKEYLPHYMKALLSAPSMPLHHALIFCHYHKYYKCPIPISLSSLSKTKINPLIRFLILMRTS